MKLKIVAALVAAGFVIGYVALWLQQHPGVKITGRGFTTTSEYIAASGHYRAGVVAVANYFPNATISHMQGIETATNLEFIWGITLDWESKPIELSQKQLEALEPYLLWSGRPKGDGGSWIQKIYGTPREDAKLLAFVSNSIYGVVDEKLVGDLGR